ncbi:alpha/beta-hydrolase [Lichtheimia hyalospora FSU 10163]|nr:alpha/beta-hydrolase [Lichtheimia hyalospora FSU 10163]
MDPNDPTTFNHQYANINGIRLHYIDANPSSRHVLLFIHGWPDLWLGWRYQIPFFAKLGYRVIVPSLRGFGETDAPEDLTTYGDKGISADLAALLDHLSIPTVVVVGHDWGGMVAWRFTQFHPERVRAVASFCTPYNPPEQQYIPLENLVEFMPNFKYQLYLVSPEAEQEINEHTEDFFKLIFRPASEARALIYKKTNKLVIGRTNASKSEALSQEVLDYYVKSYQRNGSRGSLNWYKRRKINYEQCKDLDPIIRKPALMVTAANDAALPPSLTKNMHKYIPDLTQHNVDDAAHWVLWEKPEECNKHLLNWLNKVSPAKL